MRLGGRSGNGEVEAKDEDWIHGSHLEESTIDQRTKTVISTTIDTIIEDIQRLRSDVDFDNKLNEKQD